MSGRLSDAWLEELRSRVSLEEVVSEYVPLKQKGHRFWGCCPFHNEKTPSFSVDTESQLYYCFGCHKGGTAISFIMDMERMEFMDAVRLLAERAHMELPASSAQPGEIRTTRDERERMYEANRLAARAAMGDPGALREYVENDPALGGLDRLYCQDVVEALIRLNEDVLGEP